MAALIFAMAPFTATNQQFTRREPSAVTYVTSDLDLFARVLPQIRAVSDPSGRVQLIQREYISRGSPGLQDFARQGRLNASDLARAIERTPAYFEWIARVYPERLSRITPELEQSLRAMQRLYPAAQFPDIYFVVGHFRSSGTVSDRGMLLGAEVFAVDDDTPVHEFTPERRGLVHPLRLLRYNSVHELVHVQQRWAGKETLLERALIEGTAELVASLVVPDAPVPINNEFAAPREREIWTRFEREMDSTDTTHWIANNHRATPQWPAAMAYNVGYHIAKAYYDKAADKEMALQTLFAVERPRDILRQSGYATRFQEK